MKKVFLRLAKYAAIFVLFLSLTAFVWANWSEPTPGERAAVVNFIPYDMSHITDPATISAIESSVKKIPGVRVTVYNPASNLMSVAYGIDDTDQELIETTIQNRYKVQLHEKIFKQTGPRCPVGGSLTMIARVKRFFCVRD